ncbi:vitellogenin-like isoform X2 [Amphiura filiformis]|uniref:vitellogenin-like isoform X2 n=1 Tax=Amphiura filiformis TaxID=82378 RepID=UPI003B228321
MLTLQMANEDVFTKKEEGISGTCETVYNIKERRTEDNFKVFNITKVRDLTNCTDTPYLMWKTNDLKTKECKECDKEMTQPIKAIATFKCNVTGERSNAFIESCKSWARYVMTPTMDMDDGSFMVMQNQSLVLKEVKSRKIKPLPELTQRGNIRFIFPELVNDEDKYNVTLKKVEFFVNMLSNQSFTNFTLDTPSHFIHLVRSLRECNITQLRQVWNWTEKTMYKRDWIVKALPYVNKTDMTLLVKEMFFNRTINITRHGEDLLLGLGNTQKPTIKMIQDIKDTCELLKEPIVDVTRENVTTTLRTRRACWLSFGDMIYRFKKNERFVPSTIARSLTDCRKSWENSKLSTAKITKVTHKMLLELREDVVKMHCIEAMGNAGLPDHTELLKETILDDTRPIDHRIAAVTALRRIAKEIPRKVMTILLPILRNPTEDPELRIVCWRTTLECNPTPRYDDPHHKGCQQVD